MSEKPSETPPENPENFWTTIGKQLLPLIACVLIVKFFIADIYGIPTGSMEPTLHGREHSGDRIFCLKLPYRWREPKRWEVFVFKFPYEESRAYTNENTAIYAGEYFIKRCVGLPSEEVFISRGDIFTRKNDDKPLRQVKPDSLQRAIWLPVYDEDFHDLNSAAELAENWEFPASQAEVKNHRLKISGDADFAFIPQTRLGKLAGIPDRYVRRQTVDYRCSACGAKLRQTARSPFFAARCARCQKYLTEKEVVFYDFRADYPMAENQQVLAQAEIASPFPRQSPWHFVADLRWRAEIFPQNSATVIAITLTDDSRVATLEINSASARLLFNKREIWRDKISLPLSANDLEFYRCDGEYRAFLNGSPLFAIAPESQEISMTESQEPSRTGVRFSTQGEIIISRLTVDRDIHYYNPSPLRSAYRLPENGYLALGDNSPSSNDSRNWGPVPKKNLVGPALAVWWPLDAIRLIK